MAETEHAPNDLFEFLDFYLVKKAPVQIPDAGREAIVRFGPWLAIALLVLLLPPILLTLGIGSVFVPFGGIRYVAGWGLAFLLLIVQVGILIAAVPGLFARKESAWRLLVYSQLIGTAHSLAGGNVLGGLIGGAIGLYIMFQIRTLYW